MPERSLIDEAISGATYPWSVGDEVLYGLCREHLSHEEVGPIVAKLWLIGRAYAAAIERFGRPKGWTTSQLYVQVANRLISSDTDRHIAQLRSFGPLSESNADAILEAHEHLLQVLKTHSDRSARSFASKYLHFHAPEVVPIFDSYADVTLRTWFRKRRLRRQDAPRGDLKYGLFVRKVLGALDSIEAEHGLRLTLKELDRLLWVAGESRTTLGSKTGLQGTGGRAFEHLKRQ